MAKNKITFKWKIERESSSRYYTPSFLIKVSFEKELLLDCDNIFTVDWGDGQTDTFRAENCDEKDRRFFIPTEIDHRYHVGEYQVTILTAGHCNGIGIELYNIDRHGHYDAQHTNKSGRV